MVSSFFRIVVNCCPWTQMPPTTYHIEVDRCFPEGPFGDLGIVKLVRLLHRKELRYSNHESGWQMEKCLRQGFEIGFDWNMRFRSDFGVLHFGMMSTFFLFPPGLEVDFTLNETLPHLPHVSCFGLEEVRRSWPHRALNQSVTFCI